MSPSDHANNENEKDDLQYQLEIKKLSRDISIGRIPEILLDKWAPTVIASILLFTAVPLSNNVFWKSQKSINVGISALNKMRETYSKLALSTTQFMQTVDLMDELQCKDNPTFDPKNNLMQSECGRLRKERYEIEPQIVGFLSDAELYFSTEIGDKVQNIRDLYNKLARSMPDPVFVASFGKARHAILEKMKIEIQEKEATLLSGTIIMEINYVYS